MINKLLYRGVVADDETIKLPFTTQDPGKREWIRRSWHTVQVIKGAHHCARAGINSGFEGREVNLAQRLLRHVRGVVIASPFRGAIRHPMFGAGENLSGRAVI